MVKVGVPPLGGMWLWSNVAHFVPSSSNSLSRGRQPRYGFPGKWLSRLAPAAHFEQKGRHAKPTQT
jgi:hypothetical protein